MNNSYKRRKKLARRSKRAEDRDRNKARKRRMKKNKPTPKKIMTKARLAKSFTQSSY